MCSVQDVEELAPERKQQQRPPEECMKCGEKSVVVIRVTDGFCRACFLHHCNHKFRSAFGKTKVVRHNERVLVAYSGGQASAAMLHMLDLSLNESNYKKFKLQPGLIHIDESLLTTFVGGPENQERIEQITELMKQSNLPYHVVSLSEVMSKEGEVTDTATNNERLQSSFAAIKTNTAKEDYLRHLRLSLLRKVARREGYTKLMLGDSGGRLAVSLLASVAQGRGAHLALDSAFADDREKDLITVRPLREFAPKEIVMYNVLNDVNTVTVPSFTTMAGEKSSIQKLTEAFITGLQNDFPATVSTVVRTANKMKFQVDASTSQHCVLCKGPIDTIVSDASALRASEFSSQLAQPRSQCDVTTGAGDVTETYDVTTKTDDGTEDSTCCGQGDGSCRSTKKEESISDDLLWRALCYGCRRMAKDATSLPELLPATVQEDVAKINRRTAMKESIQEFLLEDDNS